MRLKENSDIYSSPENVCLKIFNYVITLKITQMHQNALLLHQEMKT